MYLRAAFPYFSSMIRYTKIIWMSCIMAIYYLISKQRMSSYVFIYECMHARTRTRAFTHTHNHARTYTQTHTHTYEVGRTLSESSLYNIIKALSLCDHWCHSNAWWSSPSNVMLGHNGFYVFCDSWNRGSSYVKREFDRQCVCVKKKIPKISGVTSNFLFQHIHM